LKQEFKPESSEYATKCIIFVIGVGGREGN